MWLSCIQAGAGVWMASGSRAVDIHIALQRAKRKISHLQQRLIDKQTSYEGPEETRLSTWTSSKELRDSLVDMYKANPRVNVELRQRLPSLDRPEISLDLDHCDWPQAPLHLQEPLTSPLPLSHRRSGSPASFLSNRRPLGVTGDMELDLSTSRGSSPVAEISVDGGGAAKGHRSPVLSRHLITADDSFQHNIEFGRLQSFDRDKNVSFLLKELDALRDINRKLQEQLVQKEKELQRREVEEQLRGEQRDADSWERPAVVLDEVLAAQKDRDQALMSRLLLANEERDEALLRARRLQQVAELENLDLGECNQDVNELLQHVCNADSVQEVEHFGSVLVQHLHLAQQRRNDIITEEMKAVMHERDASVAKCKQLEQDLVQKQEQRATKEELLRLQRERDRALEERQQLEVELQTLHPGHSAMDLMSHPVQSPAETVSLSRPAPSLELQLQQLSKEKQKVEAKLQRCQEAEREAQDQVHRLERLVEVLRKKVGTGSLRAVI